MDCGKENGAKVWPLYLPSYSWFKGAMDNNLKFSFMLYFIYHVKIANLQIQKETFKNSF